MVLLVAAFGCAPQMKYGLKGCERYVGEELCVSTSTAGTVHGSLGPGCATSGARGPDVEDGTELSFIIAHGKVRDLAFQLGCLLRLEVTADPSVADLTLRDAKWKGLLGSQLAGPIPTEENQSVWILVDPSRDRMRFVGSNNGVR